MNSEIECEIHASSRVQTTLNHTGVHLINHALRNTFENENAILQVQSQVRSDSLKFEFKFNDRLVAKPDFETLRFVL